jgi:hypothetical protein
MAQMRCKMEVRKLEKTAEGNYLTEARAVCDGSPENEAFFESTPDGALDLSVVNAPAIEALIAEGLTVGSEIYVDVSIAKP